VEGKREQTGGGLVKLEKGLSPGANLWYAKAALDHMIFNQMQEYRLIGGSHKTSLRSRVEHGWFSFIRNNLWRNSCLR